MRTHYDNQRGVIVLGNPLDDFRAQNPHRPVFTGEIKTWLIAAGHAFTMAKTYTLTQGDAFLRQ